MSDMVNPQHYKNGPIIKTPFQPDYHIEAIEVIRYINDPRLANAVKYIWRVAFGGKSNDTVDIQKAIWYLTDWLNHDTGSGEHKLDLLDRVQREIKLIENAKAEARRLQEQQDTKG